MKYRFGILCLVFLLQSLSFAQDPPELRAFYVPIWNTDSQSECDRVINDILSTSINAVFVHVRARGDAYYFPNREDDTYPNPEPRAQLYPDSIPADFDVFSIILTSFIRPLPVEKSMPGSPLTMLGIEPPHLQVLLIFLMLTQSGSLNTNRE